VSESKEQFRRLVEHSPDAVAMVDCEMRYLSVSSRWETPCGLSPGDAIGRSHWELFPNLPEYWQQTVRAILAGVVEYSEFVEVRSTLPIAQQTEFSGCQRIKWVFQPWKNSDGAIAGLIVSTISIAGKIISANCDRNLPSEVKTDQLETAEQLQAVLDAVPGLVSWVSSDLRYLGVNCHLAAAYQMPAEVFIGQKVGFLETNFKFNDLVYNFFATDKCTTSQEVTANVKGENKTYLIVAQKYQKNSKAVFVGLDITERKQALSDLQESEECLRQQTVKLEQMLWVLQRTQTQLIQTEKMSCLGQLVAGVAHEINNPVSFISGNVSHARGYIQELLRVVELYQKNYPNAVPEIQDCIEELDLDFLKKDLVKLLNSMQVGSERIRDVVRSLRLFSRTDEAEMKSADIHEGLDSTLLILQNRLQAKGGRTGISLVKEYGDLPQVRCYPGHLNQVFMHLLTNAIDALEQGVKNSEKYGIIEFSAHLSPYELSGLMSNPEIRIRTEVLGESEVAIAISDNGPGMTEEVLGCIFDPLFTTKPPGTSTGLGLSISRHLVVEKHGGKLEYVSEPGRGTEVVIKIAIGNG
jgi:two-component system, NtrC family, sensor kinase